MSGWGKRGESQRDSGPKPRVASSELPWENRPVSGQPQRGCGFDRGTEAATPLGLALSWGRSPRVALRLPRKTVMAHGSRIPREHYDFHHVAETGVASPQTLKTWNPVTLAIEVSAQFSDNGHCFAECALVRVFFLASSPSTSHSMGLNSTSHGSSGTSRPKRANNMIRQAITASMVMARSNTSAL